MAISLSNSLQIETTAPVDNRTVIPSESERDSIQQPCVGLLVYCTAENKLYVVTSLTGGLTKKIGTWEQIGKDIQNYVVSASVDSNNIEFTVLQNGTTRQISYTPSIPTVGDGTISFTQGGVSKGSFTTNQSGDTTIVLDAGGGSVNWDDVQNKPETFTPSAHTHTISDVTNLQTSLDGKQDIMQLSSMPTASSAYAGKIVQFTGTAPSGIGVSDAGTSEVNGYYTILDPTSTGTSRIWSNGTFYIQYDSSTNVWVIKRIGGAAPHYYCDTEGTQNPWTPSTWTVLEGSSPAPSISELTGYTNGYFYKCVENSGSYSWQAVNVQDSTTVNDATLTITQGGVTKGTFTANASSNVTIALDAGSGSVDWDNVQNKPETFTPSAHNHTQEEVIGLSASLGLKANSGDLARVATTGNYSDLAGTPTIGDGTIAIVQDGVTVSTFSVNQTSNSIVELPAKMDKLLPVQTVSSSVVTAAPCTFTDWTVTGSSTLKAETGVQGYGCAMIDITLSGSQTVVCDSTSLAFFTNSAGVADALTASAINHCGIIWKGPSKKATLYVYAAEALS